MKDIYEQISYCDTDTYEDIVEKISKEPIYSDYCIIITYNVKKTYHDGYYCDVDHGDDINEMECQIERIYSLLKIFEESDLIDNVMIDTSNKKLSVYNIPFSPHKYGYCHIGLTHNIIKANVYRQYNQIKDAKQNNKKYAVLKNGDEYVYFEIEPYNGWVNLD